MQHSLQSTTTLAHFQKSNFCFLKTYGMAFYSFLIKSPFATAAKKLTRRNSAYYGLLACFFMLASAAYRGNASSVTVTFGTLPPTITSFAPKQAKPGDAVTLTGTNFNTTAVDNIVFFGATRATVTAATATSLTVTVPTGATYAPITLFNTGTSLAAYSLQNFTPTYSPAKTSITSADFAPKVDFGAGNYPSSVAIGDLDGDGKPDLVVASLGSNFVSIYRNISTNGSIGTGGFATKVDFATGVYPNSLAIGDLDGDGKIDLVVANRNSNSVSILRNISAGESINFAVKVDFTTGSWPYTVAIGDLDGDGKPDLVVPNNGSGNVSVLRNTSTSGNISGGSFAAKVDFPTGSNPYTAAIGDLDGDGKVDLVVASDNSDKVSVLRNTSTSGSLNFATKVDFATGSAHYSFAIGDLDGDGKADLAVANFNSTTVSVLPNTSSNGNINFAAKQDFATGIYPISVAIGDFDGDGKADLAVANFGSNSVSIYHNISTNGSIGVGSFAPKVDFATGLYPNFLAIGDLDGDGKPDLVLTNQNSNSVSILRNTDLLPPTITSFTPKQSKPGDAITLTGTNFNAAAANNIVFFGATRATVTAATATSLTVTVPTGATYAPITLLNTGTNLAAYSLQNFTPTYSPARTTMGTGSFATKVDFETGTQPYSVAIGDLDGDGKPDMAIANVDANTLSVYRNISTSADISTGSFATKVDFPTGSAPYSVAIGDLDGDGKPDLAVANMNSSSVSVLRNTTSGSIDASSFATKVDFTTGGWPHSVAIGDLDGDGKPDLAIANRYSNDISVLRNTATTGNIVATSFAIKVDFATGTAPVSVAIGDLDGDGKPDLAVANSMSINASIFRNTSTRGSIDASSFAPKVDFTTGKAPSSVVIGDLDGDGNPDLVVTNANSSSVSVFRNTATSGDITAASFAMKVDFTTSSVPFSVAIGDLDGDGKPDLAVANANSSSVSVLRNTTSGNISAASFATKMDLTTGSYPYSVAIGDLDGDGKPDLAVANYNSGNVSVIHNADLLPPTITSFTPKQAKPGDAVTLTGTNFNAIAANNIVFFGATQATVTAATATPM